MLFCDLTAVQNEVTCIRIVPLRQSSPKLGVIYVIPDVHTISYINIRDHNTGTVVIRHIGHEMGKLGSAFGPKTGCRIKMFYTT
jgi:hypothetical protein